MKWIALAGFSGFVALALGAYAAHGLQGNAASLLARASEYQLIHSLLLLWLSDKQGRFAAFARWLILAGILLFCGSLSVKALSGIEGLSAAAPAGGMAFMLGWLAIAASAFKRAGR